MSSERYKEPRIRPLVPSRRQLFEGPISDDSDYRSISVLLQMVGNWLESEGVEDPEFDAVTVERVFPNPESDECRYNATLYYRKEDDKS
jgi:hypothetical protein